MTEPLLRRKLTPRPSPPPAEDGSAALRPLVQSWSRALGAVTGLMVDGASAQTRRATLSEVLDLADPDGFIGLLSLKDGGSGLILLDPAGLTTLIESMTTGRLLRHLPTPRPPTATDAALVAETVEGFCTDLTDNVLTGARFARLLSDPRLLDSILDDGAYQVIRITATLSLQGVTRPSQAVLVSPLPPPPPPEPAENDAAAGEHSWSRALEGVVAQAPADLHGVLARITRPLAEVMDLGPGSRLILPMALLEEVRVEGLDRTLVSLARLGQSRGMRALRLTRIEGSTDPIPDQIPPPG